MARVTGPTEAERLQWQAEDIVRQAITKTPAFKQAVKQTTRELKGLHKNAVAKISGKKKGK